MELNQNNSDDSQDIVARSQKASLIQNAQNLNYLYPNGHRITHQMRWFKGSRYRGFKSDIAA